MLILCIMRTNWLQPEALLKTTVALWAWSGAGDGYEWQLEVVTLKILQGVSDYDVQDTAPVPVDWLANVWALWRLVGWSS